MTKNRYLYSLAMLAAALSVAACTGNYTPRTEAQYSDDATINATVQAEVTALPGIHDNTMQATTYNGVVTLRGRADSQEAALAAVEKARHVDGVKTVDYDIKVD